jgi:hypothetical protein
MTAPSAVATPEVGQLSVEAPAGSHFGWEEVKTGGGTASLGFVPLLQWDEVEKFREYYTDEGVLAIADGTSLRVSFQNIARRYRAAKKTDDEIAQAQVNFRPGKRAVGSATPTSRAQRAIKTAVEKGVDADAMAALIERITSGELSLDSFAKPS